MFKELYGIDNVIGREEKDINSKEVIYDETNPSIKKEIDLSLINLMKNMMKSDFEILDEQIVQILEDEIDMKDFMLTEQKKINEAVGEDKNIEKNISEEDFNKKEKINSQNSNKKSSDNESDKRNDDESGEKEDEISEMDSNKISEGKKDESKIKDKIELKEEKINSDSEVSKEEPESTENVTEKEEVLFSDQIDIKENNINEKNIENNADEAKVET